MSKTFVGQTPLKELMQTVLIFLRETPNQIFLKVTSSPEMAAQKNPSDRFGFPPGGNCVPGGSSWGWADPKHPLGFVILIFIYFFLCSDEDFFSQICWPNCCWSCFAAAFQLCLDRDEACDNSSKAEMFALTYEISQNWRSLINPYLQSCSNMPVLWWGWSSTVCALPRAARKGKHCNC